MRYAQVNWDYQKIPTSGSVVNESGTAVSNYFPFGYASNITVQLPSPQDILNNDDNLPYLEKISNNELESSSLTLKNANGEIIDLSSNYSAALQAGSYVATYYFHARGWSEGIQPVRENYYANYTYQFAAIQNQYPIKRLTITDCINRVLQLAEPLYNNQSPKYTLNSAQAELFDNILAPEFTMTQCTLREQLKVIGGFINAEPRLDENNVIWFDDYGGNVLSTISDSEYVSNGVSQDINQYCRSVDTSAQNLVNVLDYAQGVIVEPDDLNYVSLRTESVNVRISDPNGIAMTLNPIYSPQKVMCGLFDQNTNTYIIEPQDITPYVFEEKEYQANLSSYAGVYPYAKAYAVYYTQGEKGLKGLFFKEENAISPVFENYAIINILESITGQDVVNIFTTAQYALLVFQISYQPIYNTRFSHSKPYVASRKRKRSIIYNQSENLIETKYYGENIKGVAARLGNVEQQRTYIVPSLSDVPQVGQLFDENYYISAVNVSFMPQYIKVTLGLSKDFNRISEYVGISSNKRVYEVSEKQAYARNLLYKEYVVIGTPEESNNTLLGSTALNVIADTFKQSGNYKPITRVLAWGGTYDNPETMTVNGEKLPPLPCVQLPVISSAMGNVMTFSWAYKDNYSAGEQSTYQSNQSVSGYWQTYYAYGDYYGKMYYYNFDLGTAPQLTVAEQKEFALNFPAGTMPTSSSGYYSTLEYQPYQIRKDSREILQANAQIEFVVNQENLIVGSALANSCALVRGSDSTLKPLLYVFPDRLNKFINHVEGKVNINLSELTGVAVSVSQAVDGQFVLTSEAFPTSGNAWAIVTQQTPITQTVETETGQVQQQTTYKGGDVLLACNTAVTQGETIGSIAFTAMHGIY